MDIDAAIAELGTKLDEWFDGNLTTFASQDHRMQGKALDRGIAIVRELDRLKAEGLAALAALLKRKDAATNDERIASLIRGFEFGVRLAGTLHDELLDTNGETKVVRLTCAIVTELDAIDPSRAALAGLLDHSDAGIRASAGAHLIRSMPERVVPILRDIEANEHANSAHFSALFTLFRWEHRHTATKEKNG